ncbi:hypothetical protein Gotur_014152 [Gossypium turneri]
MQVRLGTLPSYTWRSIWAVKGLLEKGFCWRIGSGKHVQIWDEAWIPSTNDYKLENSNIDQWLGHEYLSPHRCRKNPVHPPSFRARNIKNGKYTMRSGLASSSNRPRCINYPETTDHVFKDCPFAVAVWSRLGFRWSLKQNQLQYKDWGFWMARNKLVHENLVQFETYLIQFIQSYIKEIDGVKKKLPVNPEQKENWKPPEGLNVKINFDAAFDRQKKRSCIGIVIRNSDGDILKSIIYENEHISTTFAAEALACVQVVRFRAESGFLRVEIERDAAFISDAKRMRRNFISCRFQHASRQANLVAYSLAIEGLKYRENTHLNMIGPSVVVRVDANDRNGVTEDSRGMVEIGQQIMRVKSAIKEDEMGKEDGGSTQMELGAGLIF